ncbi:MULTISPECIES: TIGR03862 family flavoprotein [Dyella]|uniref:TIGR03862 family flavoprotein n=2 Tax=Dyella TaxID=231454 RepID=A0A4R0Z515_9GAMM|nr:MULTISPECIES: TIGR03862 family flavoprotein [Dyella]TBR38929.1 TIGR03862 family flavoprotein [Dyella terrae]TCI13480.1 TIGR03862 family flavoprotein [Dyella soli]
MGTQAMRAEGLVIIGGGPAGLMAAEAARAAGMSVDVFEGKGSVGRKFLIAGKGGMNITHSEPKPAFTERYGERAGDIARWLATFDADDVRTWTAELGVDTFVGSSGRVFPMDMKAAPLLRAWVHRLRESGVRFHVRHRWTGWNAEGRLMFDTPDGPLQLEAPATVLALGGASWPQLGSDGAWQDWLAARGVDIAPLKPANGGFDVAWSPYLAQRFAGAPLKPVVAHWRDAEGRGHERQGECVISEYGIEGSLIYALSATLRDAIERHGQVTLQLDLAPNRTLERLERDLAASRGKRSLSDHLRRHAGISGAKVALLHEVLDKTQLEDPVILARTIKRVPLHLQHARPVAETISSAGGVRLEALDDNLMLTALPGVFCAGEMLDWEAPTGGYLLTACFASGRVAGIGAVDWLGR